MKVYLVMWSECDSGYEIKGAYFSKAMAKEHVDRLNHARRSDFDSHYVEEVKIV